MYNRSSGGAAIYYLASVEVDQRQNFIHQADTLREKIGASRIIQSTIDIATRLVGEFPANAIEPVWPVSGVLRFCAHDLATLGRFLWRYRSELENQSLTASIGIVPIDPHYDAALRSVERRVRARKDSKTGHASLPSLPYFAPCGIQPLHPANHWMRNSHSEDRERRELRSWQSRHRENLHYAKRSEPFQGISREGRPLPEDFDDFVISDSDSYLAIIKGDVDGLGRLFAKLFERDQPFADLGTRLDCSGMVAGHRFSHALDRTMRDAVRDACGALLHETQPDRPYPFLPLILAGDDLLIICQRHLALRLVCEIANRYEGAAQSNEVLRHAFEVSGITDERLTVSFGVAFVKKGFPFEAATELAEDLIRSAKVRRRGLTHKEGCVDFHWYESTGRQELSHLRDALSYIDPASNTELRRFTRPWLWSELHAALRSIPHLSGFPTRKLHQLPEILAQPEALSELAFDRWWVHLSKTERQKFNQAHGAIRHPHQTAANWPVWLPVPGQPLLKLNWWEELLLLQKIHQTA